METNINDIFEFCMQHANDRIKQSIKQRHDNNKAILETLMKLNDTLPDLRFYQLLAIAGIGNPFSGENFGEEPDETLKKLNTNLL